MTTDEMRRMRERMSLRQIGEAAGLSHQAVYYRLGGRRLARKAANDNQEQANTGKTVVRYMPHNGGCSTTSGLQPITLPRVSVIDDRVAA